MTKIEVGCNVCKGNTGVKEIYINSVGFIEMNLECGHKLVLSGIRLKQDGEEKMSFGEEYQKD